MIFYLLVAIVTGLVTTSASGQEPLRACYFPSWAQYRPDPAKFWPTDIDPFLCDHVLYAFSKVEDGVLKPADWNDEILFLDIQDLKLQNPDLKTLLSVGGWNHGMDTVTPMLATVTSRAIFIASAREYVIDHGFDGFDLDFEFPGMRGSPPEDKQRFTALCREMRQDFDEHGLMLTLAASASKGVVDVAYEVEQIHQYLDFISLLTYDFSGSWNPWTAISSPLCPNSTHVGDLAYDNLQASTYYWVNKGVPKSKLLIGLPMYGYSYNLQNPSDTRVGAPSAGPAMGGEFTRSDGFLSYYEICEMLKDGSTQQFYDSETQGKYIVYPDSMSSQNIWVSYEDLTSVSKKVAWARDHGFRGYQVWDYSLDDFNNTWCGQGTFPLMRRAFGAWNDFTIGPGNYTCAIKPVGVPDPEPPLTTDAPIATTPGTPDAWCGTRPAGSYADPAHCEMYFECTGSGGTHERCGPGSRFDSGSNQCRFPEDGTCQGGQPPFDSNFCDERDGGGYMDLRYCTFYYECILSVTSHRSCTGGTVYHELDQTCVHPSFAWSRPDQCYMP